MTSGNARCLCCALCWPPTLSMARAWSWKQIQRRGCVCATIFGLFDVTWVCAAAPCAHCPTPPQHSTTTTTEWKHFLCSLAAVWVQILHFYTYTILITTTTITITIINSTKVKPWFVESSLHLADLVARVRISCDLIAVMVLVDWYSWLGQDVWFRL